MQFQKSQLIAYSQGDLYRCFGEKLAYTRCFIKPPYVKAFFDKVSIEGQKAEFSCQSELFDFKESVKGSLAFLFINQNFSHLKDGFIFSGFYRLNIPKVKAPFKMVFNNILSDESSVFALLAVHLGDKIFDLGEVKLFYDPSWIYHSTKKPESFNEKSMIHAALGQPSFGSGDNVKALDSGEDLFPRLPSHELSCITDIKEIREKFCISSYKIPEFIFKDHKYLPFYLLLEAGLQPCGWLAFHLGCYQSLKGDIYIRNLDGQIKWFKPIDQTMHVLDFHVTLKTVIPLKAAYTVLMKFHVEGFYNNEKICEIETSFGYFERKGLQKSNKIDIPEEIVALQKNSHKRLVLSNTVGTMIDDVVYYDEHLIQGVRYLSPDDWYFKAHFFNDPVQPGSLGIQALLDLHAIYLKKISAKPLLHYSQISWKYRGQVLPTNNKLDIIVSSKDFIEGVIFADDEPIYGIKLVP